MSRRPAPREPGARTLCGFAPCEQPAWPARAAGSLAQAFRERCREKGLPSLLPSNSAVQSTERDGGEFNRAETLQGPGTGVGWERFGLRDRRRQGNRYSWALVGTTTRKCRTELSGKEEIKPRLFMSWVIQRQSLKLQIEWYFCNLTRASFSPHLHTGQSVMTELTAWTCLSLSCFGHSDKLSWQMF